MPDARGMVVDLGHLRRAIEPVRDALDHHLLDKVPGLSRPTIEGLCAYIAERLAPQVPQLAWVKVWREASGDSCRLFTMTATHGPEEDLFPLVVPDGAAD